MSANSVIDSFLVEAGQPSRGPEAHHSQNLEPLQSNRVPPQDGPSDKSTATLKVISMSATREPGFAPLP
jgi:hypothetical protein